MLSDKSHNGWRERSVLRLGGLCLAVVISAWLLRADEPYARSRDYDLQHSKIALRFDLEQQKVLGDVTHALFILREGTSKVAFDSVGLTIQKVTVNKSPAKFETSPDKLTVSLPTAAHAADRFDVEIRYEGKPAKGLYFVLPSKDYPNRPKQVWTQGESEDTRYYLPTYDYPNDRLTTETLLTVPASWITVANGKLISVIDDAGGMKTWTWKESLPSSTYLISIVAGEFDEVKQSWRKIPVNYYAPKGRGDRLAINYERTPAMIDLFSTKLGVAYPWEKYSQSMVDEFVAGGMENSSATTNTSLSLRDPRLVPEFPTDADTLISHELAHQWFGDLVTCKDWGHVWLNEGFATFFESLWLEAHYRKEVAEYQRWGDARKWFGHADLFTKPIVRHDFEDSGIFDQNSYNKGGWVLYMLRHQLGENNFYRALQRYLEVNRGRNVVTADLIKAIEQATHQNVDRFFDQWIYGAGAPKFDVSYSYDEAKHQVALAVKQTQRIEGHVGIFTVPVDLEITTASGAKLHTITVSKASETFSLASDGPPLMVLFDKGGQILKSADFHRGKAEWLYQLKNAGDLADRADAALALAKFKNDDEVVSALGQVLDNDPTVGVRSTAAEALGQLGGNAAAKQLIASLHNNTRPEVRVDIASALGKFPDNSAVTEQLSSIAREDHSYRARAAAFEALGRLKSIRAFDVLNFAVTHDSPDDFLRNAALRAFGPLDDKKAVPLLREWSEPGKPTTTRRAAIASLARLDREDKEITRRLVSYLEDASPQVRSAAIFALGSRGDASAIPALEALLKRDDLSIALAPMLKAQIVRLRDSQAGKSGPSGEEGGADNRNESGSAATAMAQRLDKLEQLLEDMNTRVKSIEAHLSSVKP